MRFPEGKYGTVVADPPWHFSNTASRGAAKNHYETLPTGKLMCLPIEQSTLQDAHLYLWTTDAHLEGALLLMRALCLFGVKGRSRGRVRHLPTVFFAPRGAHSAKPEALQDMAEKLSPSPRLELFARRQRPGWSSWGDGA